MHDLTRYITPFICGYTRLPAMILKYRDQLLQYVRYFVLRVYVPMYISL